MYKGLQHHLPKVMKLGNGDGTLHIFFIRTTYFKNLSKKKNAFKISYESTAVLSFGKTMILFLFAFKLMHLI